MNDGVRSRKFGMACFILVVSACGLFYGLVDGGTWVAASSLCLGIYGAANLAEKRNEK